MSIYNSIYIPPQIPSATAANATLDDVTCDPSVEIGDVVRVDSSGVIVRAQANSLAHSNVIGVCEAKSDSVTCTVRLSGISLEVFSGLSESAIYFLSETQPGGLQTTIPTASGSVVVKIGTAYGTTRLMVLIGERVVRA